MSLPAWVHNDMEWEYYPEKQTKAIIQALAIAWEALEKVANHPFGNDAYGKPIGCQECGETDNAKEALRRIEEMGK